MSSARQSSIKHSFLIPSVIAIICYANILPNDFCYDDNPIVRDNPKIKNNNQWGAIWNSDYWSHSGQDAASRDLLYRPVTLSLFRVTRIIAGNRPIAFHIVSLFLHALCTLLVALLVRRLVSAGSQSPGILLWANAAAWVAAAIFAVLPIHSEAVASVVGQADLLATAGVVGAILCHFRVTSAATRSQAAFWMIASACCAFIAMGAKESGIAVVPLVVLAELLAVTTNSVSTLTPSPLPASADLRPERQRGLPLNLSPLVRIVRVSYLIIPLGVYLALRYQALGAFYQGPAPTKTVNVLVDAPMWQHALGVLQAWGMYWVKTIFPRELCIEYAINAVRLSTNLWQFHVLMGLVWAATLAFLAAWAWGRGRREIVIVVVALVLSYLPTSNAFVLIQVFFAERIWYLPSVFVAALVGMAAYRLMDRRIWRLVGVLMLAVMVVRCWVRNSEWKNNGTLFAAAYLDHPQSVMARHLYGQWLTQNGEIERGITLIQKALEIDQGFTDAQRSLGNAYLKLGRIGDALRHFQIADMQVPGHPATQAALGEASAVLQVRFGSYLEEAKQAALENPSDAQAQLAYISMLRDLGLTHDALGRLQQGRGLFADNPDWAAETAVTLVYLNRRDEAIDAYRRSLEVSQSNALHMVELAMLLIERRSAGDIEEAKKLAEAALELKPADPHVHVALGEIRALQGDISGAKESFHLAIQFAHPGSDYSNLLVERAKTLGQ